MTLTPRGGAPALVVSAKALKKGRARAMTIKEKIRIHIQIVKENERKLREWKKKGGKAA